MKWKTAPHDDRFAAMLESWRGTPYCPGSGVKRVGSDCIRFIASGINEMNKSVAEPLEQLPQDIAFHRPETAVAALRRMMDLYGPYDRITLADPLESGDVIVTKTGRMSGPGHALFVGPRQGKVWHAIASGVGEVEFTAVREVVAIFRVHSKKGW